MAPLSVRPLDDDGSSATPPVRHSVAWWLGLGSGMVITCSPLILVSLFGERPDPILRGAVAVLQFAGIALLVRGKLRMDAARRRLAARPPGSAEPPRS